MTENKTDASRFTQHMGVVFSLLALLVVTGYVLVKQPLRAIQGDFQLTLQRQGALDDALHHVEAAQLAQQAYLLTGQESYRATSISALDALGGRANALSRPCLLYTSPSPRDRTRSRMPSSACKKKTLPSTTLSR